MVRHAAFFRQNYWNIGYNDETALLKNQQHFLHPFNLKEASWLSMSLQVRTHQPDLPDLNFDHNWQSTTEFLLCSNHREATFFRDGLITLLVGSLERTTVVNLLMPIWLVTCRKNSGPIHVIFSPSLWLQCALLCLPGSLELGCQWTAPQCESPQVINLAKSKCFYIFWQLFKKKTSNCHVSSTVRAFDLIPKLRARPEYQLPSGINI